MRSNFLQQVTGVSAINAQRTALSAGALVVKGNAIAVIGDNGALGKVRSALISLFAGVSGAADIVWTPKIQESDTTTDGDFVDVTLKTGQTLPTLTSTTAAVAFAQFFLKLTSLSKKYFRVVLTAAGTTTDTCSVAGSAVLGDGSIMPLPRGATAPVIYSKA